MQKLKVNDEVMVIAGKNKGKIGVLTSVDVKNEKVTIGGLNIVKKCIKPSQQNPTGGIIDKDAPLHWSNVAVVSPKTKKITKVKVETRDGKKIRVAVSCGSILK